MIHTAAFVFIIFINQRHKELRDVPKNISFIAPDGASDCKPLQIAAARRAVMADVSSYTLSPMKEDILLEKLHEVYSHLHTSTYVTKKLRSNS